MIFLSVFLFFASLCSNISTFVLCQEGEAVNATILYQLLGEGFHRQLVLEANFSARERRLFHGGCHVAYRFRVPQGAYFDVDRLSDSLFGRHCFFSELGYFDVEAVVGDPGLPPFQPIIFRTVRALAPKAFIFEDSLSVPIHFRYHRPTPGGKAIRVELPPPAVYLHCAEQGLPSFAPEEEGEKVEEMEGTEEGENQLYLPCDCAAFSSIPKNNHRLFQKPPSSSSEEDKEGTKWCLHRRLRNPRFVVVSPTTEWNEFNNTDPSVSALIPRGNSDHHLLVTALTLVTVVGCVGALLHALFFAADEEGSSDNGTGDEKVGEVEMEQEESDYETTTTTSKNVEGEGTVPQQQQRKSNRLLNKARNDETAKKKRQ